MAAGIYLDNSTTTRPSERAVQAMLPYLRERYGVLSVPHQMGEQLLPAVEGSLKEIYRLLGMKESASFVFTSSGAEAVNHVVSSSYHEITQMSGKNHYITSVNDEAPAIMAIGRLESMGCSGTMVPVNEQGLVTREALGDALTPRTALVSLSWAHGLLGVIQPVDEIAALCKERGVALHLDATHLIGKHDLSLEEIDADFITFNGDHFHAPKGTGGVMIAANVPCSPLLLGGLEQGGRRAGSYSLANLVALGVAAKEAQESCDLLCTEVVRLRDRFEKGVLEGFSEAKVLFQKQERVPHVSLITFPGIANEALLYALNRDNLYASIGGGSYQQISHLLTNCGVDPVLAQGAVSFALSRETTEAEVDQAVHIIVEAARTLRELSKELIKSDGSSAFLEE